MIAIKNQIQTLLQKHRASVAVWMILPLFLFGTYHLLSDGDFSFMLTAGAIVRAFAFILLGIKMFTEKTARDVSQKALTVYAVAFTARLCAVMTQEGYLPFDRSGDHVYKIAEITSLVAAGACLFMSKKQSYNAEDDCFGAQIGVLALLLPCLLLAVVLHPSLNSYFLTDSLWAYACYLETVAVVPQLLMIRTTQKTKDSANPVVEAYTSHWMFSLAIARLYMLLFWMHTYHELHDESSSYCGFAVLGSQALQLICMMEYIYHYIRSAMKGGDMCLPEYFV